MTTVLSPATLPATAPAAMALSNTASISGLLMPEAICFLAAQERPRICA